MVSFAWGTLLFETLINSHIYYTDTIRNKKQKYYKQIACTNTSKNTMQLAVAVLNFKTVINYNNWVGLTLVIWYKGWQRNGKSNITVYQDKSVVNHESVCNKCPNCVDGWPLMVEMFLVIQRPARFMVPACDRGIKFKVGNKRLVKEDFLSLVSLTRSRSQWAPSYLLRSHSSIDLSLYLSAWKIHGLQMARWFYHSLCRLVALLYGPC